MTFADYTDVDNAFNTRWLYETCHICKMVTSRDDDGSMNDTMNDVRHYIYKLANKFNDSQTTSKFSSFDWAKTGDTINTEPTDAEFVASDYALFGLRLGSETAPYKIAIICHVDTVPAEPAPGWDPYHPTIQKTEFPEGTTESGSQHFLLGRGCIDDKGPAISAFIAARCIAKTYDGSSLFDDVQLEIFFDTSEETDMATPHYLEDPNTVQPDFGVVYDAMWCVRAEKGGERPVFSAAVALQPSAVASTDVYVASLDSSPGNSANTIPDWVEAVIKGDSAKLKILADKIDLEYARFGFDDPDYNQADMESTLSEDGTSLTLKTSVKGAQHGSAPDENRAGGWNPLVSLICFLAELANEGEVAANNITAMAQFSAETFGTFVFGELKAAYLYRYDQVFEKDNGTTYAVTKATTNCDGSIDLMLDIRYALGHHSTQWMGEEGLIDGDDEGKDVSIFEGIFNSLVKKFNASGKYLPVTMSTATLFAPDVRVPDTNPKYQAIEKAFQREMKYAPKRLAIGGDKDAKGVTNLFAAGPLFTPSLGPPITYHGIMEGAHIVDMKRATKIIYNLFEEQLKNPIVEEGAAEQRAKCLHRLKQMRKKGYKVTRHVGPG